MSRIKKVLITGITGFVGSHLADYILADFPDVSVVGLARWRSPMGNIRHLGDSISLTHGDLEDLPSLKTMLRSQRPDAIFHLAAQSYVPYSFTAPVATLQANVLGTCNLLEAVRELKDSDGYNPVIHICSSSEVYGQVLKNEVPIREENPLRPSSPYAVSKVAEDMLAFQYWLSWGLKTIRTRMFTHTGPRRGEVFVVSNFAKQVAAIEKGVAPPVIKVGNLESVRTFLDVRDAVKAYWQLVEKCPVGEVYNIGGRETMTVGDMLKRLVALSSAEKVDIVVDDTRLRPSDVTLQIPCIDKFTAATGWQPEIPFDRTLRDTLDYWREYYTKQQV